MGWDHVAQKTAEHESGSDYLILNKLAPHQCSSRARGCKPPARSKLGAGVVARKGEPKVAVKPFVLHNFDRLVRVN